jgi:predicted transcriptional regulator
MKAAVTVRLDEDLERALDRLCESTGKSRSDIVRDALRRQVALMEFAQARALVMPFAEAQGYLTDEDIFRDVS